MFYFKILFKNQTKKVPTIQNKTTETNEWGKIQESSVRLIKQEDVQKTSIIPFDFHRAPFLSAFPQIEIISNVLAEGFK